MTSVDLKLNVINQSKVSSIYFMLNNRELVEKFYTAFQHRDHAKMNECYSENIVFSDPAFGVLEGDEVRAMWEMLCQRAADLKIEFSNIRLLDEEYATCDWVAHYTFSQTGNKVVNRIKAHMRIQEGKITEHSDAFKLSNWAAQALGWKGKLLGWSGFIKNKIRANARKSLANYMSKMNR